MEPRTESSDLNNDSPFASYYRLCLFYAKATATFARYHKKVLTQTRTWTLVHKDAATFKK